LYDDLAQQEIDMWGQPPTEEEVVMARKMTEALAYDIEKVLAEAGAVLTEIAASGHHPWPDRYQHLRRGIERDLRLLRKRNSQE
jgi:hypothetical protein